MADKYWRPGAGNSSDWSVEANWKDITGTTSLGLPTSTDDVFLDAGSGNGTLSINAPAFCNVISCTGFPGTLAGPSTLSFKSSMTLSSNMGLTYSGTATYSGDTAFLTTNGKIITFNIVISFSSAGLILADDCTMSPDKTLTLTEGALVQSTLVSLSVGNFVSTGALSRYISCSSIYLTGIGTVWNVSGTKFTIDDGLPVYVADESSNQKIITSTPTTGNPTTYGPNFKASFWIKGAGNGQYTATGTFYDFYCWNTGGAKINFGASTIYQNLDFGFFAPDPSAVNMDWDNGNTIITFDNSVGGLYLGPAMTITASAAITINTTGATQQVGFLNPSNKFLTRAIIITGTANGGLSSSGGDIRTTSTITLNSGTISTTQYGPGDGDVYCSNFTAAGTATKTLSIYDLHLTGTGTLFTTVAQLGGIYINSIFVDGATAISARTLTLSATVLPQSGLVYLGGSGTGAITLVPSAATTVDIHVTNTGGANISISTSTLLGLSFDDGTNAVWASTGTQTLTIQGNLYISPNAGTPTNTPALIFNGVYNNAQGMGDVYINLGKTLVGGLVTINDTAVNSAPGSTYFYLENGFLSNAALTVTGALDVIITGNCSASVLTLTACRTFKVSGNLNTTANITLSNTAAKSNYLEVTGTTGCGGILAISCIGGSKFTGAVNATTSITISNTAPALSEFSGSVTAPTFTVTNGLARCYGNVLVSGVITLTAGEFSAYSNVSCSTFTSTGSAARLVGLGNGTWTLTGTGATATVWNLNAAGLSFLPGTAIINITEVSASVITFAGAGQAYYDLRFNRGTASGNNIISASNTFTNLRDLGTATHSLIFASGTTQNVGHFVVNGSSPSARITLSSTSATVVFNLVKNPAGLVNCDNLNIIRCSATPALTWYAGANSISTTATGWIFTNMPPRKLGAGGVG